MPEQFKTCRSKYQGEAELKKNYAKLGRKLPTAFPTKLKDSRPMTPNTGA